MVRLKYGPEILIKEVVITVLEQQDLFLLLMVLVLSATGSMYCIILRK